VWLSFELEVICSLLLAQPATLGGKPLTLPLVSFETQRQTQRQTHRERILDAARSPSLNVVLVLKDVTAATHPGISWEVHVEPVGAKPDAAGSSLVGVVSLFEGAPAPAEFFFVLDGVIAATGKKNLQVRFVPMSGVVVGGRPQAVDVRSTATIGQISVGIETAGKQ
jgi:hypothetical protein